MLKILLSRDWVACRNEILSRIANDVQNQLPNRILIVPELISHDMERRLCKVAGNTVSRFAEVLPFPRLASRVEEQFGNGALQCLDNGGRIVTMAAAVRQLHSRLKTYAAVETKPEFLKQLVEAVDEFKRCCITAQDLLAASRQTEGTLAQKLSELAYIAETYDALCTQGRIDPRDRMNWCLEELESHDFASKHVIYIDGFPDFTRQHLAIIEHLIRTSPMVTIGMNCDQISSHTLAFEKAGQTAAELVRCAEQAGVAVEIEVLNGREDALVDFCGCLFEGKPVEQEKLAGRVIAGCADSVQQETEAAAEHILHLVRNGCRYRDISIASADMGLYQHVLSLVFHRCGIPLYQSGTEDILQTTVISTVLSALDAALGGFEQRDVLRYLKSALSPLDVNTCDALENYVICWGVRGSAFLKPWQQHPDGVGAQWTDTSHNKLSMLNAAREVAIEPLLQLKKSFQSAESLSDQVEAVYAFLQEISMAERLEQLAAQMEEAGEYREVQILNQLWEILLNALEQMHDTLGQTVWENEIFVRLFILLLGQYDVGTIPPVLDAVTVGPISAMRCQETKHLLVLGAVEGALPGYGGSQGLLTDQERVTLRKMGVGLTGGSVDGLQAEFADIYGVFCGASDTIYVSYPGGESSYIFRRIANMAGVEQKFSNPCAIAGCDAREAGAYLARWNQQSLAEELGLAHWYEDARRRSEYKFGNISAATIQELYGNSLRLSASQVDRHNQCRLAYFLQYGLQAKERKEYTVDPAEFGKYVHHVLEHTAREVLNKGGFQNISMEETIKIAQNYSEQYALDNFAQLDSQRLNYLFHRNWRELEMVVIELWQELKVSQFKPEFFELHFDDGGEMPAISLENAEMNAILRGYVDRVDIWEKDGRHYFRVVDYKTGKKDFDYCDVFNGVGLQMLLYLFALEKNGGSLIGEYPIGVGVQYFPARVPILSADGRLTAQEADHLRQKEWKRKGLLLSNEDILQGMDPSENMDRLSCTRKKDGSLSGDLADRAQFSMLWEYVSELLRQMVNEIASGIIEPNPYTRGTAHNACNYCPYGSICHKNEVQGRRNYKAMTAERFWDEVQQEVKRHGSETD